jgi:membrane protein YdbS with pleckstrin-like domain
MIAGGPAEPGDDWSVPSPRLRVLRRVEVAAVAALVLAAVVVAEMLASSPGAVIAISAAAVILVAFVVVGVLVRRVGSWGYAEHEDDLIVRRGLLVRRLSVIPYGRMQFVDVTSGPFERAFGLSTVRMHTAAAASDARIPGLTGDEATRLRDQLTALGEARAAGL